MSFRRFIVPALEELNTDNPEPIIDPNAVAETVVDPAVANPEPVVVKTETAEETTSTTSESDTSTTEPVTETKTETTEPAATETAPAEEATDKTVPAADPEQTPEPVQSPTPVEPAAAAPETQTETTDTVAAPVAEEAPAATPEATTEVVEESKPTAEPVVESEVQTEEEISLEELEIEMRANEEFADEAELIQSLTNDAQADDVVEQQLSAVLESLEVLAENTANIIESDQCTEETAQLIEETAASNLRQVNVELEFPAMESYGSDIKIRHQLVLENLNGYVDRIRQTLDIRFAERIKAILDMFKGYEGSVGKVKQNIKIMREVLNKKKSTLQETKHEGSLVGVSRFFNVKTENVLPILTEDLKVSEYVLSKYPLEILKNLDKLNSILSSSSYKDAENFGKFLNKVADIEPQSKIFKIGRDNSVHALLGNYGIIHSVGNLPKTLNYGDQRFPELANAAKYSAYEEHRGADLVEILASTGNPWLTFGALIIGSVKVITDIVTAQKVVATTDELSKLLDFAEGYADACLDWSKNISHIVDSYQKLSRGMEKFSSIGSEIEGIGIGQRYRAWRLLGQVKTIVRNNLTYVTIPTYVESYRALLGARSCYYLAKRLVITAK